MGKIHEAVHEDSLVQGLQTEKRLLEKKYKVALQQVARLRKEMATAELIGKSVETHVIAPYKPNGTSEATAIVLASDWHVEESVRKASVNGVNEYNLDIAKQRADTFFARIERLVEVFQKDIAIPHVVLALLGDFLTNNLHEESAEDNNLHPVQAALYAEELLMSGIKHLIQSGMKLTIVTASGNHGRTSKFVHVSHEHGHSLEYFIYRNIARAFPKVPVLLHEGAHTYLDVYGRTIRFLHGTEIRYQGGVGGITIPVNKAIAQWDRLKPAELTCFGHHHRFMHGGNFVANGSMIGYNAYALSIKAAYERPQQAFFLIDKKRGLTVMAPILFD